MNQSQVNLNDAQTASSSPVILSNDQSIYFSSSNQSIPSQHYRHYSNQTHPGMIHSAQPGTDRMMMERKHKPKKKKRRGMVLEQKIPGMPPGYVPSLNHEPLDGNKFMQQSYNRYNHYQQSSESDNFIRTNNSDPMYKSGDISKRYHPYERSYSESSMKYQNPIENNKPYSSPRNLDSRGDDSNFEIPYNSMKPSNESVEKGMYRSDNFMRGSVNKNVSEQFIDLKKQIQHMSSKKLSKDSTEEENYKEKYEQMRQLLTKKDQEISMLKKQNQELSQKCQNAETELSDFMECFFGTSGDKKDVGLIVTGITGNLIGWNSKMRSLLGSYTDEEMNTKIKKWKDVIAPCDRLRAQNIFVQNARFGNQSFYCDFSIVRKDETLCHLQTTNFLTFDVETKFPIVSYSFCVEVQSPSEFRKEDLSFMESDTRQSDRNNTTSSSTNNTTSQNQVNSKLPSSENPNNNS